MAKFVLAVPATIDEAVACKKCFLNKYRFFRDCQKEMKDRVALTYPRWFSRKNCGGNCGDDCCQFNPGMACCGGGGQFFMIQKSQPVEIRKEA